MHTDFDEKAKQIKLLICDVDGVLTSGKLYFNEDGGEIKTFHVHDGYGIRSLLKTGVQVAFITARSHPAIHRRAEELGVLHVYTNQQDKSNAYNDLKAKLSLDDTAIAYMGDDMLDKVVMEQVHLPIAVANAVQGLKEITPFHTNIPGGKGAVREVCDRIIAAQNT